jgi:hypothetical protein
MSEQTYSNEAELQKFVVSNGLIPPRTQAKQDPEIPLIENSDGTSASEFDDEGAIVAEKIRQFSNVGYRPTKDEALKYRDFMHKQETSAWSSIAGAMQQTAVDLGSAALSLAGDTLRLKIPKVAGSVVEGAALGTKNWMYMWEEAKYNEESPIHKLLYKKTGSDDEYYYNLVKTLDVKQMMDKDMREGIILPKEVEVGGVKFDLWNPATVMGISYVADPSWVAPNLGIESTLAKGMKGASKIIALNEQMANVQVWAAKQVETASKKTARGAEKVAEQIVKTEQQLLNNIKEVTGVDAFIGTSGNIVDKNDLGRGAMSAAGLNQVKIPAWGATTLAWGASKIVQTAASAAELSAKIAQEPTSHMGLRLSERLAMESENASVRALAGTWAKTGSPLIEWAGNTSKTALHSGMYGGAFGFTFGGEEGFYHGIGSGFTIGGAFHQIGAIHGAVQGGDASRDVIKNFLWATEGFDYYSKEGTMRLLELTEKENGEFAKLRLMGEIAASERLQRDVKKVILTEERIKEMLGEDSPEWADLKKEINDNPDFGGVAFKRNLDGQKVVVINADRAYKFAAKEELFHTLLMDNRYGLEFTRHSLDALVGTEDARGALLRMPKEQAVRALEQFKDAYLGLEDKASAGDSQRVTKMGDVWGEIITKFKNGEVDGRLNKLFEEFLASYWNAYTEDKPIDYLLKGGDLGLVRNAIELAKDAYKNTMHQDLKSAGAKFEFGKTIDGFFVDQKTGKRIIIPELEKLMKHFVARSSKEMYRGWMKNERKLSNVEQAIAGGLDHLVQMNPDGSARIMSSAEVNRNSGKGIKDALEKIAQLDSTERGLQFTVIGNDGESKMSFSKPKKRKKKVNKEENAEALLEDTETSELNWGARQRYNKHWSDIAETLAEQDKEPITKRELRAAETIAGEAPEDGGWSVDKRKKFWKSVWNGNPRIKVKGVATKKEIAILSEFLPEPVVNKFRHLNAVIEMSRMGTFAGKVSNIITAEVVTETEGPFNKVSDREEGPFVKQRNFQPAEINIYFERKRTKKMEDGEPVFEYESGEPQMLVKVVDHDAILTRVDYFYDEVGGDLDYKMVRRLFKTKEDLYIAAKSLLSRYSQSEMKEGGIAIFRNAGAVSAREAGQMRTIVNGVLGFHPTKVQMRAGEYANPWHELQLRKKSQDAGLPQVIKDFRVDRIGRMRSRDGEGFFYDHDSAVVRSQYNFSPSKSFRDHEGNPMSKAEMLATKSSVYRNKEGEILSVYSLNKALSSKKRVVGESVFDYVDDSFGSIIDVVDPRRRGRSVTSESGWLHYTPDMSEASLVSKGSMTTGYIDTTRHLDISNIDYNSSPNVYLKEIATGLSKLTGKDVDVHLKELLNLRDINGNRLSMLVDEAGSPFNIKSENIEGFLFTKDMASYFKKNDIHSLEYNHFNPIRDQATSAVAVWDNGRFIENTSRRAETNYFAYSPSKRNEVLPSGELAPKSMLWHLNKAISDSTKSKIASGMNPDQAALEAFLEYRVGEDGTTISKNSKQITEAQIEEIIGRETAKYEALLGKDLGKKFFDEKGRAEISQQLKPYVLKSLRKEMPFAPNKILNEIADVALAGVTAEAILKQTMKAKPQGEKGRGKTQEFLVVRDGVLGRFKKHYQMTAEKINKGYAHSLFEAVEMTEGEHQLTQKLPQFLDRIKDGTSEQWIAENLYTVHKLFGEYGGLKGFRDMHKGREKEIFLLMEKSLQRNIEDTGGNIFKVVNHEALKELYAEKTRQFVYETLKANKMSIQKRQELTKTYQKYRDINAESSEIRSLFKSYNDTIHAFIKDEFNERVVDTLTALGIYVKPNEAIVQQVRAAIYDDAKRGYYKLGSYDAIAKSVEYYYSFSNQDSKRKFLDTKVALKRNLVRSLNELEKAGFVGINFVERQKAYDIVNGQKEYRQFKVDIVHPTQGKVDEIAALRMWDFDGTFFKVVEVGGGLDDSVLKLIDTRNGREVLTQPTMKADSPDKDATVSRFIQEATARIHKEVPSTVLNTNFGKIDGPMKAYILLNYDVQMYGRTPEKVTPDFTDWDNFDLYKNGDYFVAIRKWKSEDAEIKATERIRKLKEEIASGETIIETKTKGKTIRTKKKLSIDDILDKRLQVTQLQGKINKDFGLVLKVDEIGRIEELARPISLSEQSLALSQLKSGKMENRALQFYVTELYGDYVKAMEVRRKKEQEKIDRVLSDGKDGNIAKIKALEKTIQEAETALQSMVQTKLQEMNKELKKAGIKRDVTAIEAYKRIKQDLDGLRKNSDNANSRLTAIEKMLMDLNAFPEFSSMNPEKQRIFLERISDAGKDEWIPNPLTGKLELTKSDWVTKNLAKLPEESNIEYASRLRKEWVNQKSLYQEYSTRYEQLADIVDRKNAAVSEIEDQLVFLVRQYGKAKGMVISEKTALDLITRSKVNDELGNVTTINISKLKKFTGKKVAPSYLADKEGVVPDKRGNVGSPERFETAADYKGIFANVLANVSENWKSMSDAVTTINTLIERQGILQNRGEFKEARPDKKDFESPRQFEEALGTWMDRKAAYENNYLQILGTIESWGTTPNKSPYKAVGLDGLPIKRFAQRQPRETTDRIRKLMDDELGQWNLMFGKAVSLARRRKNNGEFNFSDEFESLVGESQKLSMKQEAWVRDPANRERVQELQDSYMRGDITENQLVETIQNESYLTAYGQEGFELVRADEDLSMTRTEIASLLDKIDAIKFGELREKYDPNYTHDKQQAEASIERINKQLEEKYRDEAALVSRIENIISAVDRTTGKSRYDKAKQQYDRLSNSYEYKNELKKELEDYIKENPSGKALKELRKVEKEMEHLSQQIKLAQDEMLRTEGSKDDPMPDSKQVSLYQSDEFRQLVDRVMQSRKSDAQKEVERVRRNREKAELAKVWAEDYTQFLQMFKDDAKELGISEPNIIVSPNNPRTRHLYNAFARVTYDLYGTVHPLDWSGSGYDIEYSAKGEQLVKFRGAGDPANLASQTESATARRLYTVADYMYFARKRAEYHMANPDAPMSAEDYLLVTTLVPKSRYVPSDAKVATINKLELANKRRVANGILDNTAIPENRNTIIRTFVKDGLNAVINSKGERLRALKRISGMDDVQWNEHIKGKTDDEVLKMASTREVIENAFYWITEGFIPLSENSKKTVKIIKKDGTSTAIKTQQMDIQRLIEFEEFKTHIDEQLNAQNLSSMFDTLPYAKTVYEAMAPEDRMMLTMDTYKRLAMDNSAEMLRHQREVVIARGQKPVWFGGEFHQTRHTGRPAESLAMEQERISRLIAQTTATEASIQRYKSALTKLVDTREAAVRHMLSLQDGLHFPDLTFKETDGIVREVDSWKESADGRYIIQRVLSEKKGESFRVYYIGETIKNADGATLYDIPTARIGNVENTTHAQALVRIFEDDIHRIKQTANLVSGGLGPFEPLRVGDVLIARQGGGAVLKSAWDAPAFSNAVIAAYKKIGGKPENIRDFEAIARPMYDFGETQRIVFTANGQPRHKEMVITPSREGILKKYFDRDVSDDGIVRWIQKPKKPKTEAEAGTQTEFPSSTSVEDKNPNASTSAPSLPEPTKEQTLVSDASEFTIISNKTKDGQTYDQWEVIKNKLGYQIVRVKEANSNRDVFKLFNPSSVYLGQYYDEMEAVDEVLAKEFQKLEANE